MKDFVDEGKFAAPRWLVYPELSAITIGWRMGYGEDYCMNEPYRSDEFYELFPEPQNWMFDERQSNFKRFPLLGFLWRDDGNPKYSKINPDAIFVNEFIKLDDENEFRCDTFRFKSIEHAVLLSKYLFFDKCDRDCSYEELKKGFELTEDEIELWDRIKYTVCLNAAYYKIMEDPKLKEKLLKTGNKTLVYYSNDEWGGDENLFGFALMELRDEIHRLCKNEDLIDLEYTEYIKNKNPYEDGPKQRSPEDKQSPEYMILASVLQTSNKYVRDVNLDEKLASRYEIGQIITERAFLDASPKIGGMITSHRYLILSNQMADLSQFEQGTNWGLHTARRDSSFKVSDIYTIDGKTQIVLLHLPEGFEEVFENTITLEKKIVKKLRKEFEDALKLDPVEELTSDMWLKRCEFPVGMDDDGVFWE